MNLDKLVLFHEQLCENALDTVLDQAGTSQLECLRMLTNYILEDAAPRLIIAAAVCYAYMDLEEGAQAVFTRLTTKARELMLTKNHDYTNGSFDPFFNFRAAAQLGVQPSVGVQIRMLDKVQRLCTATARGLKGLSESAEDSVIDLINYAVLYEGLRLEEEMMGAKLDPVEEVK